MVTFEAMMCGKCGTIFKKTENACREITLKYDSLSKEGVSSVTQLWCTKCLEKAGVLSKDKSNDISTIKENMREMLLAL